MNFEETIDDINTFMSNIGVDEELWLEDLDGLHRVWVGDAPKTKFYTDDELEYYLIKFVSVLVSVFEPVFGGSS
jgi:hypothetical protein